MPRCRKSTWCAAAMVSTLEIIARGAVTPKVSTLDSPARLVLDLPNTAMASEQNHINVGSDGVKGVRLGTNGMTPPTTRVVVDLDKAVPLRAGSRQRQQDCAETLHRRDAAKAPPSR